MAELMYVFIGLDVWDALKVALILAALCTFEPITNCFRKNKHWGKEEFLFFSNIAMVYTALGIFSGVLRHTDPRFGLLHDFIVPTATILEIVVVAIFWTLFFVKRSLVIRTNGGPGLWPVLRECPKHLFPMALLVTEHLDREFLKSGSQRVFLALFSVVYFGVCEVLILREENYLYPFLECLPYWKRAVVFLVIMGVSLVLYELIYF